MPCPQPSHSHPLTLTLTHRPPPLTQVDTSGFAAAMEAQRARSAAAAQAAKGGGVGLALGAEQTAFLADSGVAFTDDQTKFVPGAQPSVQLPLGAVRPVDFGSAKFFTYDSLNGWNNQLLNLLYAIDVARLLGRTLIVPPSNYEIKEGPIREAAAKLGVPFSLYTGR